MTHASQILDAIARETWAWIRLADQLNISLGETTITDTHLIALRRWASPQIEVYKAIGRDEPDKGFDWEWWVASPHGGWWRYSIQAKRIDVETEAYSQLRHHKGHQLKVLDAYSVSNDSIPAYCFYNWIQAPKANQVWHCPLRKPHLDAMGCTLVPLEVVRPIHDARQRKTFASLHSRVSAIPWSCVATCNGIFDHTPELPGDCTLTHPMAIGRKVRLYRALPPAVVTAVRTKAKCADVGGNSQAFDSDNIGYPKRIAVIDPLGLSH